MRYQHAQALLTAGPSFGRLSSLPVNERADMAERSYDQLQARAVNSLDNTYSGDVGTPDQQAQFARAQTYALLAVGAAIKDLAEAIRERQ